MIHMMVLTPYTISIAPLDFFHLHLSKPSGILQDVVFIEVPRGRIDSSARLLTTAVRRKNERGLL